MRILFAGTPEFALEPLRKLNKTKEILSVITQPDRPKGRKGILTPSPVKLEAERLSLPVLSPERLGEEIDSLKKLKAELMITCAYGQILSEEILNLFPYGVLNIHASLLPAYRGAAPIARAIIDGCKETGITIMKTERSLDTGDILLQKSLPIEESDTAGSLSEKLSLLGADLCAEAIEKLEQNAPFRKQGEGFVCKKVFHTQVDFSKSAEEVSRLIRGLSPSPLAYAFLNGQSFNFYFASAQKDESDLPAGTVLSASPKEGLLIKCGRGAVKIEELQISGGKRCLARDFLNGRKLLKGQKFEYQSLL